ncbi:MAG: BolA family transcriptional regulator [Myxococcales bacterium]|nr:BolA family transcriptional regulator [Myxococcales bacterium]
MPTAQHVQEMIETGLENSRAIVHDMTGTGDHFEATVISSAFEGKSLVAQHQLVYGALGPAMGGPIHALALKTMTPAQWAATNGHSQRPG